MDAVRVIHQPARAGGAAQGSEPRAALCVLSPFALNGLRSVTYVFKCFPDFCSAIYFFAILAQV